ncbi:tRNA glutamyl-Q(34) synthetase GluQRS [Aquabacterium sp.]|uniref:tRNA glutamyl-Q(34) synthetase GluQRS n=1 Tax=Aquabacterium sp. TaxID=1872578 RepID=UPI002CAFD61D|nr:tRNA glutamyl-Q(34) synthetase GluQRS [Aquabacterium sp.]HSW08046.1 tRNA glutamyl-Q(34) synthetase GluQRS [Aquabacterium sp.]
MSSSSGTYVGRFAPSPTGALHVGSLVAALASWLDARAHDGRWLVRIEDVDTPRCLAGADQVILGQLAICGLLPDEEPIYQSRRGSAYQAALYTLQTLGLTYPCGCTRREIEEALIAAGILHERFEERVYPGTCRAGLFGKSARATRVLTLCGGTEAVVSWQDRRLGAQHQNVAREVGDFVLHRADGLWAYQLAVVVDDAAQGITDIVRGEDLADNTARQIHLQHLLGLPTPSYLHCPLVLGADGHKLSKQNGAVAFDASQPLAALQFAATTLALPVIEATSVGEWLNAAVQAWAARWVA